MKRFLIIAGFIWTLTGARAVNVGDGYAQVVQEKGKPQNQMEIGATRVLNYPDVTIKLTDDVVVAVTAVPKPKPIDATTHVSPISSDRAVAAEKKRLKDAIGLVQRIVNQEVTPIARTPAMKVAMFKEGWFHPGATIPDFNHVDVRATRETSYDKFPFVCSAASPDVVYVGSDLEFNSMTKCFYIDRTVPKKKLTEREMLEVNRLYRTIGNSEDQLKALGAELPQ